VHITYLRADGRGKAKFDEPDDQRECRGVIRGGTIRLAPHDPVRELLIAEGVETTLAAIQIFGLPGWAAIYADNLKDTLELPTAVRRIVIAADNDFAGTGQRAAGGAHRRWTAEGRSVRIVMPAIAGDDFNNVLIRRGR
jgi:putative DNA primase/helicase